MEIDKENEMKKRYAQMAYEMKLWNEIPVSQDPDKSERIIQALMKQRNVSREAAESIFNSSL